MKPGYFVYIVEGGRLVKIGVARDPEKRLATLQTGSPLKLKLIGFRDFEWREQAHRAEAGVHDELSMQHEHGEWFRPFPIDPMEMLEIYHVEHRNIMWERRFIAREVRCA